MKKTIFAICAILTCSSPANAASVVVTNYDETAARQLPVSSFSGAPLLSGGIVAVGTFNASGAELADLFAQLPNPEALSQLVSNFVRFGNPSSIGSGFPGLFEADVQQPLSSSDVFVGKSIYTLIGNASTLASSTELALIRDPGTFNYDNPLFAARADISNPGATVLLGSLNGPLVTSALGAAPSLRLAGIPEPVSSALLFFGLALGFRRRR